jgi:hypothetical protein
MAAEKYPALLFRVTTLYVSHTARPHLVPSLNQVLWSHASGDFSGTPPDVEVHNYRAIQSNSGVVLNRISSGGEEFEVATSLPEGLTYVRLWNESQTNPATHLADFQSIPSLREQFPVQPPKATP